MNLNFKTALTAAAVVLSMGYAHAQSQLWGGLEKPQSPEELPVGRAAVRWPQRVSKLPARHSELVPDTKNGGYLISGGWVLTDLKTAARVRMDFSEGWFDATVPGTVLTTLVEQGVYPDPYYGLNNLVIPDSLARTDWMYLTSFMAPDYAEPRVWIQLDGVNYRSKVFLNGIPVGEMKGAFERGRFDVSEFIVRDGANVLAVHVFPPDNPGIPHEQSIVNGQGLNGGALSLDGPTFISSVGWDWVPGIRDRNVGIWQPVRLYTSGDVVAGDPLVVADLPLPDTTRVRLTVRVPIANHSAGTVSGEVRVDVDYSHDPANMKAPYTPGGECTIPYTLAPGQERELTGTIDLENPHLWWPNGYGEPALYTAHFAVKDAAGAVSDRKMVSFGIREYSYELMVELPDGSHRRVLHTPTDAREETPAFDYVNRGRYSDAIQLPRLAGVTDMSQVDDFMSRHGLATLPDDDPVGPYFALRVNGRRVFCRGGNWGMDDGMKRVSEERLAPYFELHRRAGFNMIRNWTGESTEQAFYDLCDRHGIMVWNDFWITTDDTVEPTDAELFLRNAADAVKRFRNHPSIAVWCPRNEGFAPANLEKLLPPMMAALDPTRHYHGQSRYLNMDTSGPWSYFEDPSVYYTKNAAGFITEIGTFAIPTARSIRKFIPEEDIWPINDTWAYHDLHHTSQNFAGFIEAVGRYGAPRSMEDFERKAQLVCYDAWRAIMESWNSRMWNTTTGQLLWMSHPAWPSMIWQTHTWDYQTPGSYFGAKKASEPLHAQLNLGDSTVMVVNNTRRDERLGIRVSAIDPASGKVVSWASFPVNAPAAGTAVVGKRQSIFPLREIELPALHIVRLELTRGRETLSVNDYWMADDTAAYAAVNDIAPARLKITERGSRVAVRNVSSRLAVNVKLDAVSTATGEEILPAYFSDGYFNLLPGEVRTLTLSLPEGAGKHRIVATGYNIQNDKQH